MDWNQFKEADDQECMKDALSGLQNAKNSLVEALTSIDEAVESISDSGSDLSVDIELLKLSLLREKESLESIIQLLD